MDEVLFRLQAKGCIRCCLHVTTDIDGVVPYYEKRGWKRMDYVFTFGKDLD